ncbi:MULTISPECIES: TonB-dependent receptor [unclassified Pseudoalteromonas]|uniref:TonB-dependent receptor plug domain-containing protein n=1 Tax=unclassified Pseudoalteromonas TaxID=194690 RepID=UPI002097C669|nr:TonB-dependent receptor [Pseudoalteromonas sp. XMcav2-N]MCO7190495.1 TonB-dependent receptor [Pseudoalteromonas sp. XMcav2-N]
MKKNLLPLSIALLSFSLCAREEALFELTFEELMDVTVELASKTSETAQSVPSSVTLFSRQQISLLGIRNVYELMNFVPGFQSTRGDWVGSVPKEHARGVFLDNGNILIMLNGQRLNDASFGKASVYAPFIPVEVVDKVEFIRGPGSALYGSNAFLGVMNIVTRQSDRQVQIGIGLHQSKQASLSYSEGNDTGHAFYANVSAYETAGETYDIQQARDPQSNVFVELGGKWGAFSASLHLNRTRLDEFINLASYSQENFHTSRNIGAKLSHQTVLTGTLESDLTLSFIQHDIDSAGLIATAEELGLQQDFFNGPKWQSEDLTLNWDLAYQHNKDLMVHWGLEYSLEEQSEAGTYTSHYDPDSGQIILEDDYYLGGIQPLNEFAAFDSLKQDFDSYAAYLQLRYQVNERLTVFTGLRFDEFIDIDNKLSPRIATIYQANPHHVLKLQYGESFRIPVSNELNSNDDITRGNPQLKSENIKTTELVWHMDYARWQADLVLFENQLDDFISLEPVDAVQSRFTFSNSYSTTMQGLEASASFELSESSWFKLNYTQHFDDPFSASYKRFGSWQLNHQFGRFQVGLNGIWRAQVKVVPVLVPDDPDFQHYEQKAHWLIGGTLTWHIASNKQLRLKAQNLFDEKTNAFDPRVFDGRVPQRGQQLLLQYAHSF